MEKNIIHNIEKNKMNKINKINVGCPFLDKFNLIDEDEDTFYIMSKKGLKIKVKKTGGIKYEKISSL